MTPTPYIVLVRLPTFTVADVKQPAGARIDAGTYVMQATTTDAAGNGWVQLQSGTWIVASSDGHTYAVPEPPPASPGAAPWAAALAADRVANATLVASGTAAAHAALSLAPGATAAQRLAVATMVDILGLREDTGANAGNALTPMLVSPWCRTNGIAQGGFAWCAIAATYAQHQGLGLGDWTSKATWKNYPLGGWLGSASGIEAAAIKRGTWVPASKVALVASDAMPGALVVSERAGSGSDAAGKATHAAPGASYAGHVDLCCGQLSDGTLGVIGGNLSNTAKYTTRRMDAVRGLVLLGK